MWEEENNPSTLLTSVCDPLVIHNLLEIKIINEIIQGGLGKTSCAFQEFVAQLLQRSALLTCWLVWSIYSHNEKQSWRVFCIQWAAHQNPQCINRHQIIHSACPQSAAVLHKPIQIMHITNSAPCPQMYPCITASQTRAPEMQLWASCPSLLQIYQAGKT